MFGDPVFTINGYTLTLDLIPDSDGFDKQWYCIYNPDGTDHSVPGYTYGDVYDNLHIRDYFLNFVCDNDTKFGSFVREMYRLNCEERLNYKDVVLDFSDYVFQNVNFIEEKFKKELP